MTSERSPKGGTTVAGVFYKGGQFLPSNNEPKRGAFNRPATKAAKVRKVEVAPRVWVEAQAGMRSLYQMVAGTVARFVDGKLVYSANAQVLDYVGLTETRARELVDMFNSGERWLAE